MSPSSYCPDNDIFMDPPNSHSSSHMMDSDHEDSHAHHTSFPTSCLPQHTKAVRKQVRFGLQSVCPIESVRDMTLLDLRDRYFDREELQAFKKSAKKLCKQHHLGSAPIDPNESVRGMDVYFPSRQRTHAKYIHAVVQAYLSRCRQSPELLAQICETWSTKSRERAVVAGTQDFYDAYFPGMAHASTSASNTAATSASSEAAKGLPVAPRANNKRAASTELFPEMNRTL